MSLLAIIGFSSFGLLNGVLKTLQALENIRGFSPAAGEFQNGPAGGQSHGLALRVLLQRIEVGGRPAAALLQPRHSEIHRLLPGSAELLHDPGVLHPPLAGSAGDARGCGGFLHRRVLEQRLDEHLQAARLLLAVTPGCVIWLHLASPVICVLQRSVPSRVVAK
jgi:hypothetical protein